MIEYSLSSRTPIQWLACRLSLAAVAAALADWLFFDQAGVGLSLALFLGAVGLLTILVNPIRADKQLRIGPQAIPAYDRYVRLYAERTGRRPPREEIFARAAIADIDWRSWTFRGWRLKRYFDTNPQGATPMSDDASGK